MKLLPNENSFRWIIRKFNYSFQKNHFYLNVLEKMVYDILQKNILKNGCHSFKFYPK